MDTFRNNYERTLYRNIDAKSSSYLGVIVNGTWSSPEEFEKMAHFAVSSMTTLDRMKMRRPMSLVRLGDNIARTRIGLPLV